MAKAFSQGFWNTIAGLILRNRLFIIIAIIAITAALATQWQYMRFSYTEANLLPDDHPVNQEYNAFLDVFGEEGNLIVMGVDGNELLQPERLRIWNEFMAEVQEKPMIELAVGLHNLQRLRKDKEAQRFVPEPLITGDSLDIEKLKNDLFYKLPFYDGLVYAKRDSSIRAALYVRKELVNTGERRDFILEYFTNRVNQLEEDMGMKVHVSGMPYIRTLNSQNIVDEIGLFVGGALLVTGLIFLFFFRSWRATLITLATVLIGVMWTFGFLGLLNYEITVLTALIPPLIIVIGVPNCIFLINKYQQEYKKHGNQALALQRVITKVGNATLMTNMTTASGFATFILTESSLLKEFGVVASISIIAIFILSLLIIPVIYSWMHVPNARHLRHLSKRWIDGFVNWLENMVRNHKIAIYIVSTILLALSIAGISFIRISGSLIEDMPQKTEFFKDIRWFEEKFDGIMPVEIMVDTKRPEGVIKPATLKRINRLEDEIRDTEELSNPLSVVGLVKYAKQTYYNGNPKYYQLPTSQERNFILPYLDGAENAQEFTSAYIDSTGQFARITTFMKDMPTERMENIEADLRKTIDKEFPADRYDVSITGKSLVFQKGTNYLVNNLLLSLGLAIVLISLFMAWMFRSFKMILVSLIPNILPLLVTAGLMGYLGVPLKPSTILVFSIAFGIAVDDTIHFLAKYRQELIANNWKIKKSVYAALRETGVSMFYTSIVLFFGFLVFTISSFGGTVALGALVSATLLFAMLANLLLLPCLLLSFEDSFSNEKTIKEGDFKIIPEKDV